MIEQSKPYSVEYNCLVTDLVNNFPPNTKYEVGSVMYAFDGGTKEISKVFVLLKVSGTKEWYLKQSFNN